MNEIKSFIVEINKKFDGEWFKKTASFSTLDEVLDYINGQKVNRFTLTVVRKKDAEEQGVLL